MTRSVVLVAGAAGRDASDAREVLGVRLAAEQPAKNAAQSAAAKSLAFGAFEPVVNVGTVRQRGG